MLGKRKRQKDLFTGETMLGRRDLARMGFYRELAKNAERIFVDDDFASMYSERGRPSVPPSMLALATLLQFRENLSDREVIERARYDLRWKVAFQQDPLSTEAPFSRTTLQVFRSRLALHEKEGAAFERSIELARDSGLLPKRLFLAADSTSVRGRGAVKDTYALLSDAIAAVVRKVSAVQGEEAVATARAAGLERHLEAPSIKGSEEVDWQDAAAVSRFLAGLLHDAKKAAALARESGQACEEVDLLERIIRQDIDEGDDETPPSIRNGVAKDRIVSVSDPEIRMQRDSHSKKTTGHKVHAVVDTDSGVITALKVTSLSDPEGGKLEELVEQTRRSTGSDVEEVLGDCAYGTNRAIEQADAAGVKLRSRMPRGPRDRFGPRDFEVSDDLLSATCPAGHPSVIQHRRGDGFVHTWSPQLCGSCPLRTRCTRSQARQLRTPSCFHDRRERETWAWSAKGRRRLKRRVRVEHSFGRSKGRGAGKARYFGRAKTRFQWLWTAAGLNLSLLWRHEAALA